MFTPCTKRLHISQIFDCVADAELIAFCHGVREVSYDCSAHGSVSATRLSEYDMGTLDVSFIAFGDEADQQFAAIVDDIRSIARAFRPELNGAGFGACPADSARC